MQLHPTSMTLHVAFVGTAVVALGAAARLAPVAAFGGAMLLAVAVGRALALVGVTRLREAGFEMAWSGAARVHRVTRGGVLHLTAEMRNRSEGAVRCVRVRPIVSAMLSAEIQPDVLDIPPWGRAQVDISIVARRIGRWGVHGLALEVRGRSLGGEGLYEVPLLFASPLGVEVLPRSLAVQPRSTLGAASSTAQVGRRGIRGDELRELRDHVPGDPFKRIAWKASARRGRLLVREVEREERHVVWLVVDASVDLWAGAIGEAPLDEVVEQVARHAAGSLKRGDRVGLVVSATRLLAWVPPEHGAAHGARIASALAGASSFVDADRSALDETEVAQLIVEHARPLDPRAVAALGDGDVDGLARWTDELHGRAPFSAATPFAATPRERALRRHLAAFGVESPPRADGERDGAEAMLARVLERLAAEVPRPTSVHVWAPAPLLPAPIEATAKGISRLRARRVDVRWCVPTLDAGIATSDAGGRLGAAATAIGEAVQMRAQAMRMRGERSLLRLGARMPPKQPYRGGYRP